MKALQANLNSKDKKLMEKLLSAGHIQHKFAVRLQTVLLRDKGRGTGEISDLLMIDRSTVSGYINRYNTYGINSLLSDKTRKPGKEKVSQDVKDEICRLVCNEKPAGETHWSCRTLAKRLGIGHSSVNRILRELGLQAHRVTRRNYSPDPDFEKKLKDVVGLYLKPPENAIVWCIDEKTQIQALERAQPILPILRKVPERHSKDYMRHGTTTLFAALNMLSGRVIGECNPTHNAQDYIRFLKKVDKACAPRKVLHIVTDNVSTHKTKAVIEYLGSKPGRFVQHFVPTYSSWLNMVERWFAEITNKNIRRGSFESVAELTGSIKEYIKNWNKSKRAFVWTKKPNTIIKKIRKAKSC